MITIKQTIGKAISIYQVKSVTLAYASSVQFEQAMECAHKQVTEEGQDLFDTVSYASATYADEQCQEELSPEFLLVTYRSPLEQTEGEPLAVLITDLEDEISPDATYYQFLYQADRVEITDNGNWLAVFGAKSE